MFEEGQTVVVIDSGPDFRQQMLRAGVQKLDGLVFTHEHKDHLAGMDDVRGFNYVNNRAVPVYATTRVQEALHREYPYVFDDFKYPGVPEIEMHTIGTEPFTVGTITLVPIEVLHYRLPVLGFRVGDFTYITDANSIPERAMEQIRGSRFLVLNALRKEPHVSHFTLDEALEIIERVKPEKAFLTHISHQLGSHQEVNATLPKGVCCAYDGLKVEF